MLDEALSCAMPGESGSRLTAIISLSLTVLNATPLNRV